METKPLMEGTVEGHPDFEPYNVDEPEWREEENRDEPDWGELDGLDWGKEGNLSAAHNFPTLTLAMPDV
jgi:hypothetical protein